MSKPNTTRRDLEAAVIKKAMMDEGFRKQLLTDPRSAVDSVVAEIAPSDKLPPDVQVRAIEEPPNAFYLVVPPSRPELSVEELEQVAGGTIYINGHPILG